MLVDMNAFSVAFIVKGWYCSVSFGVSIVSMSIWAVQPGSSMFLVFGLFRRLMSLLRSI